MLKHCNRVFQPSFYNLKRLSELMNYSVIVIPAFLSKIPTLQVFLGVGGSYSGSLKSSVDIFCTHTKVLNPV